MLFKGLEKFNKAMRIKHTSMQAIGKAIPIYASTGHNVDIGSVYNVTGPS